MTHILSHLIVSLETEKSPIQVDKWLQVIEFSFFLYIQTMENL